MPGLSAALKIIPASRISRSNSVMLQTLSGPSLGKRFHFGFQIALSKMVFRGDHHIYKTLLHKNVVQIFFCVVSFHRFCDVFLVG